MADWPATFVNPRVTLTALPEKCMDFTCATSLRHSRTLKAHDRGPGWWRKTKKSRTVWVGSGILILVLCKLGELCVDVLVEVDADDPVVAVLLELSDTGG